MKPTGSSPRLQVPATCPYPETHQSSPCPPSNFLMLHFNIILPSTPGSSMWSFAFSCNHQNHHSVYKCPLHVPILRHIYPVHAPHQTSWCYISILSPHLRLGLLSGFLPLVVTTRTVYSPLIFPMRATCPRPSHSPSFELVGSIWAGSRDHTDSHMEVSSSPPPRF